MNTVSPDRYTVLPRVKYRPELGGPVNGKTLAYNRKVCIVGVNNSVYLVPKPFMSVAMVDCTVQLKPPLTPEC
jgi:hypothetical protein